MKLDILKAKESWNGIGLNERGIAAVHGWIDELAANVQKGNGRWDAFAKFAKYDGKGDYLGAIGLLKSAAEQTSKV